MLLLAKAKQVANPDDIGLLMSLRPMMVQTNVGLDGLGLMHAFLLPSMDNFQVGPFCLNSRGPTDLSLNITKPLHEMMRQPSAGPPSGSGQINKFDWADGSCSYFHSAY